MKNILTFLLFEIICISVFSQDWAPIGAKWYYDEQFASSGDIDYIKYTSEKDTIVNGQSCRKINKRHDLYCYERPEIELMFSKNDSVFFYDPKLDTFQLLYNFNAIKNDSWFFSFKEVPIGRIDTVNIVVDSIGSMIANTKILKILYVTYTIKFESTSIQYPSRIIEKIGDASFMFRFYPSINIACDMNYTNGIRCYEDPAFGNYHFLSMDSCTYTYKWTEIKSKKINKIIVYPNPSNKTIQIAGLNQAKYYQMSDINGKLIKSDIILDSQIVIKDLLDGFYILSITDKNGLPILKEKIIKN
jgi:Secretion system C-terminal sorting domain